MLHRPTARRDGASALEFAIVGPIVILILFAIIVGAFGIFQYQQVAALARESARWASTRGADYESETGNPAATRDTVYDNVIVPRAVGMDLDALTCAVSWDEVNSAKRVTPSGGTATNIVSVTVTYEWDPGLFIGPVTMSSTSKMPMSH